MLINYDTDYGEWEYEVYPEPKDYADYYYDRFVAEPSGMTSEQRRFYRKGALAALTEMFDCDDRLCQEISKEDDFCDYIKDAYREEAFKCLKENFQ